MVRYQLPDSDYNHDPEWRHQGHIHWMVVRELECCYCSWWMVAKEPQCQSQSPQMAGRELEYQDRQDSMSEGEGEIGKRSQVVT